MKLGAAILTTVTAAALAGCGDGEQASWEGPPRPLPKDGRLPVDRFAEYVDAVEEPWERSAVGLATAYVLPAVRASGDIRAALPTNESETSETVVVTVGRLFDDSVRELRFVVRLDALDDGSFRLVDARWQQRCHAGRGHETWSPEACV
jgi:hypothetical protein